MKHVIAAAIENKLAHARLLNTFSYLEYLGFRKIVKTQNTAAMNLRTLSHALEEGRHARLLKKMAVATGGIEFDRYDGTSVFAIADAKAYLDGLEQACRNECSDTELIYLYVTWLIELRAIDVYTAFAAASPGDQRAVHGLLSEEDGHLADVALQLERCDSQTRERRARLAAIEARLYTSLVTAIEHDLFS
ncbi:MAG: hypothetical protein H7Z43_14925 [Clostridia bacterium]|nr:hypothetical protein [Deltaproteobacteria bacterium]